MLEQIYRSQRTIHTLREGPFGPFIDELASLLIAQGYSTSGRTVHFATISDFNCWVINHELSLSELDERVLDQFIREREKRCPSFARHGGRRALQSLMKLVRRYRQVPMRIPPVGKYSKDIEAQVKPYRKYLREDKGLCHLSVSRYMATAQEFLFQTFGKGSVCTKRLSDENIVNFIKRCADRHTPKVTQTIVSALRSFLRFLKVSGQTSRDLSGCITPIPGSRAIKLPAFLTKEETVRLLKTCDRRTVKGRRNYAVLLLLLRLGLRACEIMGISLQDIDWERGEIIIRGKGSRRARLPLPQDVGEALVGYLKRGRPRCRWRNLFICLRAPYRGFNHPSTVSTIVSRSLSAGGLDPECKGAHLLRYTAATQCFNRGATIHQVGDLLGHHNINTTAMYTKIDVGHLSELAQVWPDLPVKEN